MTDDQFPPPESDMPDLPENDFSEEAKPAPEPAARKRGSLFGGLGKKKAAAPAAPAAAEELGGFEDDAGFAEGGEGDVSEEGWEEFDEEAEDANAVSAGKAKSKNFSRAIIVGAVVIGGGIVFLNMGGGGGNPSAVAPPTQVARGNAGTETANANMTARDLIYGRSQSNAEDDADNSYSDAPEKSGVLNDPLLMKDIEAKTRSTEFDDNYYYEQESANAGNEDDGNKGFGGTTPHEVDDASQPPMPAQAMTAPAKAGNAASPAPSEAPAPMEQQAAAPAAEAAPETASSVGLADAMNPPPDKAASAAAGENPARAEGAPADVTQPEDTEIAAVAVQQEEINPFAEAPAIPAATGQAASKPAPAPAPPADSQPAASETGAIPAAASPASASSPSMSDTKLDALLNRLDQIEAQISTVTARQDDQIGKIQKSINTLQTEVRSGTQGASAAADLTEEVPSQPAAAPAHNAQKASKPATQPARKATRKAPVRPAVKYVLKSAQPGWAMVAKGDETYTVSVGESLPGIGKVLQIYDKGGQWVVRGSRGVISQ
jgi:hypothetical protein